LDWQPIILTFKLALVTTVILFIISLPIAYWLAQMRSRVKPILEALITMPLVLPPTVIGFYLLIAFSPNNSLGSLLNWADIRLVFSFSGLVVASLIYSLPFMVQPLVAGLQSLPTDMIEASYVLGKSEFTTFRKVKFPNITSSLLVAMVLTFAHTLGEFGIVLMIGGSIPNETRVASIAIFEQVEALNYANSHLYSATLLVFAFLILLVVYVGKNRTTSLLPK
jgi:molybdate transport system permease protein